MGTKFKAIEQRVSMSKKEIISFQILFYGFANDIYLNKNRLEVLTLLGLWGKMNISDFCQEISDRRIFSSSQAVRNYILECIKDDLVIRSGAGNKIIEISDKLELLVDDRIYINMKLYTDESEASEGVNT